MQPLIWDRRPDGPAGPGDGVRLRGLERRRGRGLDGGGVRGQRAGGASASRTSTPRSSTTSRPTARGSASPRRGPTRPPAARSSGRRWRCSRRSSPAPSGTWCWCRAWSRRCGGARSAPLIVELAEALGVQLVITVGALLADVPHTLPVAMTGFSSDPALMRAPGSRRPPQPVRGPHGDRGRPAHRDRRRPACPR